MMPNTEEEKQKMMQDFLMRSRGIVPPTISAPAVPSSFDVTQRTGTVKPPELPPARVASDIEDLPPAPVLPDFKIPDFGAPSPDASPDVPEVPPASGAGGQRPYSAGASAAVTSVPAVPAAPALTPPAPAPGGSGRERTLQALFAALGGVGDAVNRSYGGQGTGGVKSVLDITSAAKEGRLADEKAGRERETYARTEADRKEKADPNSAISKEYQTLAAKMRPGRDFSMTSAAQLEPLLAPILKSYEIDKQLEGKREEAAIKGREKSNTLTKEAEELAIPGYKLKPGIRPQLDEAKKARDSVTSVKAIRKDIDQMRDFTKRFGSFELTGTESADMKGLVQDIQTNLRTVYDLGTIQPADLRYLESIVTDPSSIRSLFTADKTREQELNRLLSSIDNKMHAKLSTMGYEKEGGSQEGAQGGPAPDQDKEARRTARRARIVELQAKLQASGGGE